MEVQHKCNRGLIALAREFDLPLVAANDVHFLERAHHEAHDVMICIGTGAMVYDEKRMRYTPELYFKSPQEMRALFAEVPEAIRQHAARRGKMRSENRFQHFQISRLPPAGGQDAASNTCANLRGRACGSVTASARSPTRSWSGAWSTN